MQASSNNPLTYLGVAAALLLPLTAVVNSTKYFIEKYNPWTYIKGIFKGEPFKDLYNVVTDVLPGYIKPGLAASLILAPMVTTVSLLIPTPYMVATPAPIRTAYRYILEKFSGKKEETIENKVPEPAQ